MRLASPNTLQYNNGYICIATEFQTKSAFLSKILTLTLDKLYFHVFGDAPCITCHFTVLQEFKTQAIKCLDGQAV